MKAEFRKNMGAATSGPEFEALVAGIDEAADMLKHEIIRGDLSEETGRYSTFVRSFLEVENGLPFFSFLSSSCYCYLSLF
jgi:hypothetical protein